MRFVALLLITAVFLSGCASCGRSRKSLNSEFLTSIQNTINGKTGTLSVGVTKEQVKAVWGEADERLKQGDIWVYSTDMNKTEFEKLQQKTAVLYWIYFENGKVSKIQQYDLGEYKFGCSTVDL